MPNPYRRAQPGQKLRLSAAAWNKMIEAAQTTDTLKTTNYSGDRRELPAPMVLVKNTTAEARNRFDVLAITGPVIPPADNEAEFSNRVALIGTTPIVPDHAGRFAVLAEPLGPGKIGRAYVSGVAPAWIKGAGDYVDLEDGTTTYLLAQNGGSARVLWSEAGEAERWALIRFADGQAAAARWGKADTDWTEFGELPVTVWTGNPSSGTESDPVETVTCIAPGTDGEGMAGVVGLILRVEGYGPDILHQFLPLQCGPTAGSA